MRLVLNDKTLVEYKNGIFQLYPEIYGTALENFVTDEKSLKRYLYKRLSLRPHSVKVYSNFFGCDCKQTYEMISGELLSIQQIAGLLDGCRTPTDPVVIYKD